MSKIPDSTEPRQSPLPWASGSGVTHAHVCRYCGGEGELRFCAANRGVAYQCITCAHIVGNWISHPELGDIQPEALPRWVRR
jgi:hypothetical protein